MRHAAVHWAVEGKNVLENSPSQASRRREEEVIGLLPAVRNALLANRGRCRPPLRQGTGRGLNPSCRVYPATPPVQGYLAVEIDMYNEVVHSDGT